MTISTRLGEIDTYRARAAECRAQADEATLQNVKDRCLRAEEAWTGMAQRLERHEKLKAVAAPSVEAVAE
ncbi:hypothetical protein G7077_09275 [Sphingomonas piscis]|uniref:Uncharacterized protein n=1 Tax=Sphingomonas piscis TaxID=2714943 RepID=A0A6G7YQP6_9SPHN|nr:hypothetical protein [Sphingomonas piscis]QIK79054.1 hypothetical protein G7077_09275 [Sphingomonas piscis]